MQQKGGYRRGQLTARPRQREHYPAAATGLQPLELGGQKEALLYVSNGYDPQRPVPLVVLLHGAGGTAVHGLSLLQAYAERHGLMLLAPASRDYSWDIIAGKAFGPDVIQIDGLLSRVFEQYAVDPARLAIGGFSDGASYALSLGLINGALFTHLLAFSPGFYYAVAIHEKPVAFISHGLYDTILPIEPCSRRILPKLQLLGIKAHYTEFNGRHEVPADITAAAVKWFLDTEDF